MWARASLFCRFTDTVPLNYGKLATKYLQIYGYFYSVSTIISCHTSDGEDCRVTCASDVVRHGADVSTSVARFHVKQPANQQPDSTHACT